MQPALPTLNCQGLPGCFSSMSLIFFMTSESLITDHKKLQTLVSLIQLTGKFAFILVHCIYAAIPEL